MARKADFTKKTKDILAAKVGYKCSNPFCRIPTLGAKADSSGVINIGEAAHITAAAPGGPRYDSSLTDEQRKDESNGIWLCRTHAALIDRDESYFTVDQLRIWKSQAEKYANDCIQGKPTSNENKYYLQLMLDDLLVCSETIDFMASQDKTVVLPSDSFPITSKYEEKLEKFIDLIGISYASRIRNSFKVISCFKQVMEEENIRFKGRIGIMADTRAVAYDYHQKSFLDRIKKYDLNELCDTLEKLLVIPDKGCD